tara:strand:- start:50 stop:742 length:693 start_codon:yes stop_codon:yes gene_type:complete
MPPKIKIAPKDISITFDPGARGSFLYVFLQGKLQNYDYEFNVFIPPEYKHTINPKAIAKFKYRIFVKLDLQMLDVWLFNFWQKIITQEPYSFPGEYDDVYQEKTFNKLYKSARNAYNYSMESDLSCFNYIVPFSRTFDWKYLSNLYFSINNKLPTNKVIIEDTNKLSKETNTACKVVKEIIRLEDILQVNDYVFTKNMYELYLECLNINDIRILEKNLVKSNYTQGEFSL